MRTNLTKPVTELLKCVQAEPGLHGIVLPKKLRSSLQLAERSGLISYTATNGWQLTPDGEQALAPKYAASTAKHKHDVECYCGNCDLSVEVRCG